MGKTASKRSAGMPALPKAASGIQGFDEITGGGLPRGRPTLVCGSAGCGKTLLSMEFLVRGALEHGEPGVFMAFEETRAELADNMRSLGFDLDHMIRHKQLVVDYVRVERSEIEETGDYDLEGLFVRLGHAIATIGAKRVVLDTLETLFSGLDNLAILRAELRRLFRWLKDQGVTAIITAERGEGLLTRHGLEEYVSDCVILLDHRVIDQVSTRRLRIIKYRGSVHGTNEYPFLIDADGISVLPITSIGLQHATTNQRVPSGIARLDAMLGGAGYYRGSTVLVSGTAGSGKTSLAAHFVDAACQRGEKCLHFAFEESPAQIIRNMRSIGIALEPWVKQGLLKFHAIRSTMHGLEMHLATFYKLIRDFQPRIVVFDPIGTLSRAGSRKEASATLTRLIDYMKAHDITAMLTDLTVDAQSPEQTEVDVSSLVDTWVLLRDMEARGERNRLLYILKSRGMAHSNQLREFLLTERGIQLTNVYQGPEGVLTGSMRLAQEAREQAENLRRQQESAARLRERQRKRDALEARIAALRAEFAAEEDEAIQLVAQEQSLEQCRVEQRRAMGRSRRADPQDASDLGVGPPAMVQG